MPPRATPLQAAGFVGIDQSLTATAVATSHTVELFRPPDSVGKGVRRLAYLRDAVTPLVAVASLVGIEGYSYGSKGNALFQLGELGGVLRLLFHDLGVPFVVVAPGTWKRAITGNGNAGKDWVLSEAVRTLGYTGRSNDEADAFCIRETMLQAYGVGTVRLPTENLDLMKNTKWPRLAR